MFLKEKGRIYAIPELEGKLPNVEMSHEAAVGKIEIVFIRTYLKIEIISLAGSLSFRLVR